VAQDPAPTTEALPETSLTAESTPPAGRDARHEDSVTGSDILYRGTDLCDGPDSLVAEDSSRCHLGKVAFEDVEVAPTNGGRVDANHGVGLVDQLGIGDFVPALLVRSVIDERFHNATPSLRNSQMTAGYVV
jgi:hypothetical protein